MSRVPSRVTSGRPTSSETRGAVAPVSGVVSVPTAPPVTGLTSAEAAARLARDGMNELAGGRSTALDVLVRQLQSPLLGLLLTARDRRPVGRPRLSQRVPQRADPCQAARLYEQARTVLRDGRAIELPALELVVGDACVLRNGQCSRQAPRRDRGSRRRRRPLHGQDRHTDRGRDSAARCRRPEGSLGPGACTSRPARR